VFTRGPSWDESGSPTHYSEADCAADMKAREHHTSFRRFFEASPWLEAMTNATQTLTAQTAARMVQCGVNIAGFDQLEPFDGRLEAMVWSWAKGQPSSSGGCALQGTDTRFHAAGCGEHHRFACVDGGLDWHVTQAAGEWRAGADVCSAEFPGSSYGVPPNGYRNGQLASARPPGTGDVWLDYAQVQGSWVADPPVSHGKGHAAGHGKGHDKTRHRRH
jgi:hypothetical protein